MCHDGGLVWTSGGKVWPIVGYMVDGWTEVVVGTAIVVCVVVVVRCDGQLSTFEQVTTRLVMSVISIKFLAEVWLVVAVGTVVSDGTTDQAHRRVIGLQVDGCCVSVDSIDWVRTKLQRPAFAMSQHRIHQTLFSVCHVRRLFPAPVNDYAGFHPNADAVVTICGHARGEGEIVSNRQFTG